MGVNLFPHNYILWQVWKRSLFKTLWEKEKLLSQAISPFSTMFCTLSKTEIIIFVIFNLSSAYAFSLVWSKILSFGNGLTLFKMTNRWTCSHWKHMYIYADHKLNVTTNSFLFGFVENIVGKGENGCYQHFLVFLQCFWKASSSDSLKLRIMSERVK